MLDLILPATDNDPAVTLYLEHSLVSLSKWEQIFEKPFFGLEPKTPEETSAYIECMILGEKPPEGFHNRLVLEHYQSITAYINSKQTATTFRETQQSKGGTGEMITNELIYYWLVQFQIPFHPVETWHLNRLMTLVKIAGIKQTKQKPMSKQEQLAQMRKLNEERLAKHGTTG
jgi:hypothetical protein